MFSFNLLVPHAPPPSPLLLPPHIKPAILPRLRPRPAILRIVPPDLRLSPLDDNTFRRDRCRGAKGANGDRRGAETEFKPKLRLRSERRANKRKSGAGLLAEQVAPSPLSSASQFAQFVSFVTEQAFVISFLQWLLCDCFPTHTNAEQYFDLDGDVDPPRILYTCCHAR